MLGHAAISELPLSSLPTSSDITFDAASNSGYKVASSSYSWSHTCSGSNSFLAVDVSLLSAGQTVTGITYNSVALSLIVAKSTVTSFGRVECWGLANPATGSNTIAVTLSGSVASSAEAVSYSNVHQTVPTEAANSDQATNVGVADATVVITSVASQCWIHAAIATSDTAITANQTSRNNVSGAGGSGADEDFGPQAAGAKTMSWTDVGALATWATAGYAIRPANATGGAVNYMKDFSDTLTPSGALAKADSKSLVDTLSPSAALAKADTKPLAGTSAPSSTLAKTDSKPLAGTSTPSASFTKVDSKPLAGTSTPSGVAITRSTGKGLTGTATPYAAFTKDSGKGLVGTVMATGASVLKVVANTLSGAISLSASFAVSILQALSFTGTVTPSGSSISKNVAKAITDTVTPSAVFAKTDAKVISGTAAPSSTLAKVGSKPLSSTVTPSGSTVLKAIGKVFGGATSLAGSLVTRLLRSLSFSSTATPSGSTVVKVTGKALAGSVTPDPVLLKDTSQAKTGSLILTGAIAKAIGRAFSGLLSLLGSLSTLISPVITPPKVRDTTVLRRTQIDVTYLKRTVTDTIVLRRTVTDTTVLGD